MSQVKIRLQIKLLDQPKEVSDLVWGPYGDGDGTFLRLEADGSLVWSIRSVHEELSTPKVFRTGTGILPLNVWTTVEVSFDPETEEGDIAMAGMSLVESEEGGNVGNSMSKVTQVGTGSEDYLLNKIWFEYPDREVLEYELLEVGTQRPETKSIEPVRGTGSLGWESGKWRLGDEFDEENWWCPEGRVSLSFEILEYRIGESVHIQQSGHWDSGAAYQYWGFNSFVGSISPSDLLSDGTIVESSTFYLSGVFSSHRVVVNGFDARNYVMKIRRADSSESSEFVVGDSNTRFSWDASKNGEVILGQRTGTDRFLYTTRAATLSEQIEAKVKPAYEKDNIHYNIDDEPVQICDKGFIIYDDDETLLPKSDH